MIVGEFRVLPVEFVGWNVRVMDVVRKEVDVEWFVFIGTYEFDGAVDVAPSGFVLFYQVNFAVTQFRAGAFQALRMPENSVSQSFEGAQASACERETIIT